MPSYGAFGEKDHQDEESASLLLSNSKSNEEVSVNEKKPVFLGRIISGLVLTALLVGSLLMYSGHSHGNTILMKSAAFDADSPPLTEMEQSEQGSSPTIKELSDVKKTFNFAYEANTTYTYPSRDAGYWNIYKLTVSIAAHSTKETIDIIQKFIYGVVTESILGCDTYKLAVSTTFIQPVYDYDSEVWNGMQQGGLHFVASDIFQTRGVDLTKIVNYIDSLGNDNSEWWHNKMIMFAPDFVEHYTAIYEASLEGGSLHNRVQFRLSQDPDGVTVAHVAFMLKTAGQVYEFIGPASLLTEAQLADFTTFGEDECMIAQLSPISMADAQNKYTDYYASNATNTRPSMGVYKIPITVAITIPVSTRLL
jgi:hypothetical protein